MQAATRVISGLRSTSFVNYQLLLLFEREMQSFPASRGEWYISIIYIIDVIINTSITNRTEQEVPVYFPSLSLTSTYCQWKLPISL